MTAPLRHVPFADNPLKQPDKIRFVHSDEGLFVIQAINLAYERRTGLRIVDRDLSRRPL
jgi:hypothetical protein